MKKLLYCAAALAVAFFAGSCQQEKLEPVQESTAVTFTVEAPAAVQTRAIADGLNVNELVYEVWLTNTLGDLTQNAQKLYRATTDMKVEGGVNKATLTLDLVNDQKFTVLFWAQVKDADPAYNTEELTKVTYARSEYNANDESLAAFYAVAYVDNCQHVKKDGSSTTSQVTLYRPFAQLNLGTLNTSTAYTVKLLRSKVKVTKVNTVFNVATSKATEPAEMIFKENAVPADPSVLEVNASSYQYAGMNYLFAGDNITVEYDIWTSLNGGMEAKVNNTVGSVPLKENYRTNIIGNLLTSKVDYEIVVDAEFNVPDEYVGDGVVIAKNSDELLAALKKTDAPEHLTIELLGNQTKAVTPVEYQIPVGANEPKYYFGGDKTRTITINANGNKINFVHKNGDWNYIRMVNEDAKWIINDATLTNSGKNDGPWNRHDIRFYNAVELNDVTSDKAIALLNDGKINNVKITEDGDVYGLWITAEGQTVDIDGLSVTAGRGIAIKDEYVGSPAKVNLAVENSKFTTSKKSAVLVTSTAGAVINWGEDNDITGVAADPINAVWVDEDRKQYASEVKVEGASKVVEGAVENVQASGQEALKEALAAAKESENTVVVNVEEGTYGTLPALTSNVVLNCAEGTVFEGKSGVNINGATVIGATFSNPSDAAAAGTVNGTFKDCVFEGYNGLRWCYAGETVVFENCVFSGDLYGVHFDGGQNAVIFKNCTFSGFNAFGGAITMATFDGCTFVANGKSGYNGANLWGNTTMTNTEFTFDGTATEWVDLCGSSKGTYTFNGCTVCGEPMPIETIGVYTDNNDEVDITYNGVYYENYKTSTFISTAEELVTFANDVNVNKNSFAGKTVYLMADVDLDGIDWEPIGQTGNCTFNGVFEGNNHTISNLSVDSEEETGANYSSGLFGWIEAHTWDGKHGVVKNLTIDGATINGHHNCAVVAGYLIGRVENCHVKNAEVNCTVANDEANGDKAGSIAGILAEANAFIKDCSATTVTIKAGRDAGQIVGAALNGWDKHVTGCTATDVTVEANGTGTGKNIRNELVGRLK